MEEKAKIGNFEAFCLLLNMVCAKIVLDYPRTVSEDVGSAAWIMIILDTIVVFVFFAIISPLYEKFLGKDLIDISEIALKKVGKIIIGIIFIVQILYMTHITLREFAEDIKVISLTATPISVVIILFCIAMIVGAYLGIEAICRVYALSVPILTGALTLILMLNSPKFDISRIAPWFGLGVETILKKGLTNLSQFSEIVVLLLIAPFLNNKKAFKGIGRLGILLSGFFLAMATTCYLLIYQFPTSTEFFLPMYQMARIISFGRFFTRIEPAFILIWVLTAFLYLSSSLYFITYIFQRTFDLKYRRPLIVPFIIILFTLSILPENLYSTLQIDMQIYSRFSWIIAILLPLILVIIASVRSRKNKEAGNK